MGEPGCRFDAFQTRSRVGVSDVVGDASGEQAGILQDNRQIAVEIAPFVGKDILSVEQHGTGITVVEPGDQIYDGRLSRTGFPDQGDVFPVWDTKGNVLKDRNFPVIGKRDVSEFHIPFDDRSDDGVFGIRAFFFAVHHFKDAFRTCQCGLYVVEQTGDLIERCGEMLGIAEKCDHRADGDHAKGIGVVAKLSSYFTLGFHPSAIPVMER